MTLQCTVNFLPSWQRAPTFRTCNEDGTHHFSQVKKLALSGKQYIHACNAPFEPTRAMLIGTAVHVLVLGSRPGKPVLRYEGDARRGKAWDAFRAEHADAEILTATEWDEAEEIAAAVKADPIARARLDGARFEVPLTWDDGGLKCSTSGIDIVSLDGEDLADLKTTTTTQPEAWTRQAFKMLYPQQMAWYRRGARANGIKASRGLYILGVEMKAPFEVVELELTEGMIDFADRTVSLWLEKLRVYRESNQWPGYAQSSVPMDVPGWLHQSDDDEADDAS
jgi:hypothetical protein